jgi:hypothetical protein
MLPYRQGEGRSEVAMNAKRNERVGTVPDARQRQIVGWGLRTAAVLATAACVLSGSLIWLVLSRPLEVAGALAHQDGWHVAVALARLLAGTASQLAAWL